MCNKQNNWLQRQCVYTCVVAVTISLIQNDLVEDDWLMVAKAEHVVEIRGERNDTTKLPCLCIKNS